MFSLKKNHGSRIRAGKVGKSQGGHPLGGARAISTGLLSQYLIAAALCSVLLFFSPPALAADDDIIEVTANSMTFLQQRISEDVADPMKAAEVELRDFPLSSADIPLRMGQIAKLTASASEDMSRWGYTNEERERYTYLLSDLKLAYAAYHSNLKSLASRQSAAPLSVTASKDTELPSPASPDINVYDALRKNIQKTSQELDIQVFYLRSILSKLEIALADVNQLKKDSSPDAQGTEEGGRVATSHIKNLELERARLKLASAWRQIREAKLRCDETIQKIREDQRQLSGIRASLTFPEETLNQNIEALQKRIDDLKRQLSAAKKDFDNASTSLTQARAALPSENADTDTPTPENSRYMERMANLNYWEYHTTLLQDEIEFLSEAQTIWRARYRLFNGKATGEEIWKYRNDAQSRASELQIHLESIQALQNNFYQRISNTQALAGTASGKTKQNLNQTLQSQQNTITKVFNRYAYLLPTQILLQRTLYEEASARIDTLRLAEKVGDFSKKTFLSFWHTELWKGEDYSVTVSRLVTALLVFISSFFLSAWGSRWIQGRMLRRFSASVTAANATQRIVFYLLWFSFALTALQIVGIPLTAFAFLGGALVLGIGFGAQTLFNNLISGFIIMFSRPFRIADIIEVDGIAGTVEEIGSRSTRIKTWENVDIVLPNRYLLENRVMNWTGSDNKKRDTLKIGVSYGSDSRRVEELLQKVLKDHSKVLKDPAPFVLFKEFGESSLEFVLYFWVDLTAASSPKVASDMRHHIHALFRSEGIEIPYPQLDVRFQGDPKPSGEKPAPVKEKKAP